MIEIKRSLWQKLKFWLFGEPVKQAQQVSNNDAINTALYEIDRLPSTKETRKRWTNLMAEKIEMTKLSRDATEDARIKSEAAKFLAEIEEEVSVKERKESKHAQIQSQIDARANQIVNDTSIRANLIKEQKDIMEQKEAIKRVSSDFAQMRNWIIETKAKEKAGIELTPIEEDTLESFENKLNNHEERIILDK